MSDSPGKSPRRGAASNRSNSDVPNNKETPATDCATETETEPPAVAHGSETPTGTRNQTSESEGQNLKVDGDNMFFANRGVLETNHTDNRSRFGDPPCVHIQHAPPSVNNAVP